MKVVAIIPARGGSKRIETKNTRDIAGRSLLARAIDCAQAAEVFERIVVSTDDDAATRIASELGVDVHPRNSALADDLTVLDDVVLDAMSWLQAEGPAADAVCLMNPTAPMRTISDVRGAVQLLRTSPSTDFVSTATIYRHHPYYALADDPDRGLHLHFREDAFRFDRKRLPMLYRPIAVARLGRWDAILRAGSTLGSPMRLYEVDGLSAVDIDDPLDLSFFEFLLERHPNPMERIPQ